MENEEFLRLCKAKVAEYTNSHMDVTDRQQVTVHDVYVVWSCKTLQNNKALLSTNFPKINQLTRAQVAALEQTAEDLHTEVEQAQVFPRDTGALQNESTFVDTSESSHGKASIISSTPYARRLYFHPEFHFKKEENPNAKGKWYEDWLPGGKNADFAVEAFKENYRRLAGL